MGPDFPSLAGEIAEPHPDMNIKVTAFKVSKKFYYTSYQLTIIIVWLWQSSETWIQAQRCVLY